MLFLTVKMLTIHLDSILEYVQAKASSRNIIEGQNIVNSGMIIVCGISDETEEVKSIYALCLQTSALTSNPHTITGKLTIKRANNNLPEKVYIQKMVCEL